MKADAIRFTDSMGEHPVSKVVMVQLSALGIQQGEGLYIPCHRAIARRLLTRAQSQSTSPSHMTLYPIGIDTLEGAAEHEASQHQLSSSMSLVARVFYAWMSVTFWIVTPDQSSLIQGTTLRQHQDVWDQLFPNSQAAERVREGFDISVPDGVMQHTIPKEVPEPQRVLLRPLKEDQIRKGICKPIPGAPIPAPGTFYLKSFPVAKATPGKYRDCIDGRPLNALTTPVHFKGEGIDQLITTIRPGDWAVTSDWEGWYNHANLSERSKPLSRTIMDGKILQYECVTFGLHEAPAWLNSLTKPPFAILRGLGLRFGGQVDDWAWLGESFIQALMCGQLGVGLFCMLGCILNSKGDLIPSQHFTHLGGFFNTRLHRAYLTRKRVMKIQRSCQVLLGMARKNKPVHVRQLASLIGQVSQARHFVYLHRVQTAELMVVLRQATEASNWDCEIPIPAQIIPVILWWKDQILTQNGKQMQSQLPSLTIVKDASQWGWGAHVLETGLQTFGFWERAVAGAHSTEAEIRADIAASKAVILHNNIRDMTICIRSDATTSVAYINKHGGSKPHLARLVTEFLLWCWVERKVMFTAQHIPGVENSIADKLSRRTNAWTEMELTQSTFQTLEMEWGPHTIDAFASMANHKVQRFISWHPDPKAEQVDCFQCNLTNEEAIYAFPQTR